MAGFSLDTLFDRISVDPSQLALLNAAEEELGAGDDSSIFYVTRYPSSFVRLALNFICAKHELYEADDSFLRPSRLARSVSGIIALRNRKCFELSREQKQRYRGDLLGAFSELAEESKRRPILLVPVSLFAGQGPSPFPLHLRSALDLPFLPLDELWTVLISTLYRNSLRLDLGPPIWIEAGTSGSVIFHTISRHLYYKEKAARGARSWGLSALERHVLSGAEVEEQLSAIAVKSAYSLEDVHRRARKHLRNIAATMNGFVIRLFSFLLLPALTRLFERIDVRGLEALREFAHRPVLLLPNHKSHTDYLIFSSILFQNGLPLPYIAAGDNLNLPVVGSLLRGAGGFFIRRKIERDPLYKFVLDRYLQNLVKQGQMIEFFIEGGRSRAGHLRDPKLGLLKYVLRALQRGTRRDVVCIPVGISYERVIEDRALCRELLGERKRKESLFQLLKAPRLFRRGYGVATVSFGNPISLREFIQPAPDDEMDESEDLGRTAQQFAQRAIHAMCDEVSLTLPNLICSAIGGGQGLKCHPERLRDFLYAAKQLLKGSPVQLNQPLSALLSDLTPVRLEQELIRLTGTELFQFSTEAGTPSVSLNERLPFNERAALIEYYSNGSLHALLPALIVLISRRAQELSLSYSKTVSLLWSLFHDRHQLPPLADFSVGVGNIEDLLQLEGLLSSAGPDLRLTTAGSQVLSNTSHLVLPALTVLEAMYTLLLEKELHFSRSDILQQTLDEALELSGTALDETMPFRLPLVIRERFEVLIDRGHLIPAASTIGELDALDESAFRLQEQSRSTFEELLSLCQPLRGALLGGGASNRWR